MVDSTAGCVRHMYKLCVLGASGVGKTSLALSYTRSSELSDHSEVRSTIGCGVLVKTIPLERDEVIIAQLWDTAGQERFAHVCRAYYASSHAVVLVYSLEEPETLNAALDWYRCYTELCGLAQPEQLPVLLLGNKLDAIKERSERHEEAQRLSSERSWAYAEVSARTGEGVRDVLCTFIKGVHELHSTATNNRVRSLTLGGHAVARVDPLQNGQLVIVHQHTPEGEGRRRTNSIIRLGPRDRRDAQTRPRADVTKETDDPSLAQQCCSLQ